MRGLPACGKSFTARQLAGESGIVLETDQYFYAEVGEDPRRYDYDDELLPEGLGQGCDLLDILSVLAVDKVEYVLGKIRFNTDLCYHFGDLLECHIFKVVFHFGIIAFFAVIWVSCLSFFCCFRL